jgi:tetratricopeptide (TPR) repeat protein
MFYILRILTFTCIRRLQVVAPLLSFAISASNLQQRSQECDASTAFQQVDQLISKRQYDQAAAILDGFRGCAKRTSLETFQLGWLYGRARRFSEALKVFGTVPSNVPDPLTHDYAIALSSFELGQYQQAIDILKADQISGKADEKSANLLAVSYSKLGLYKDAYDVLSDQVRRNPSDLTTYLNLVTACAEAGNVARAADVAGEAKQRFPNSPDVFIVLGAADTMLGHLDHAFDEFSNAVRLSPGRADARFFLALVDYKQGNFSDAVNILQAAAKDGIADSDLHYLIAECLLKMNPPKSQKALHELDRAIELNSNSVSARTLRGKLLLEAGHSKDAVADLEMASRRDPDSRAALYNLARAYQTVGRTSEAQALFKQYRSQSANPLNEFSDTRLNEALAGKAGQQQ